MCYRGEKEDLEPQGQEAGQRQRWQKYQQTMGQRGRKAKTGTRSQTERDGEGRRHRLQGREREDLKDGDREPVRERWRKKIHRKKSHSSV